MTDKVVEQFILVDDENGFGIGPFKTAKDAKRYAKLNEWGPEEGSRSRFGPGSWHVMPISPPDKSEDGSYTLTFEA